MLDNGDDGGLEPLTRAANLGYAPAQLRLAVTNLTDRKYHEHLAEGLAGREVPAPGRSLVVSYQLQF